MKNLSDQFLLDAYKEAVRLKLSKDFINLLQDEIKRRNLNQNNHQKLPRD